MALILATSALLAAMPSGGLAFDAGSEFSAFVNPNGVWSYGWSTNLGSAFQLSTTTDVENGFDRWTGNLSLDGHPSVYHNGTGSTITVPSTLQTLQAGQLAAHPGSGGEYALVRWTAPTAGNFSITTSFFGVDQNGASVDVHVLRNSIAIFNGTVTGFNVPTSFFTNIVVGTGDTIDFAVGYGSNGTYFDDLTGLSATIIPATIIPEPTTLLLTAVGVVCTALFTSRRKK